MVCCGQGNLCPSGRQVSAFFFTGFGKQEQQFLAGGCHGELPPPETPGLSGVRRNKPLRQTVFLSGNGFQQSDPATEEDDFRTLITHVSLKGTGIQLNQRGDLYHEKKQI